MTSTGACVGSFDVGGGYEFDRDTSVVSLVDGDSGIDERFRRHEFRNYECRVVEGWDILGNANGGYLLSLLARAAVDATGRPDVISASTHYLAPVSAGPARIRVETVRSGRRFATAMVSMHLDRDGRDREVLRSLLTLGDLRGDPGGPSRRFDGAPDVAPYDSCTVDDRSEWPVAIRSRVDCRFDPRDAGLRTERRSGEAVVRGWFEFVDRRPIDSLSLLLACDAFPPALFNADLPLGWVPTMDLSFQLHGLPTGGPVMCSFRTRHLDNGLLEEDGEIWDASGNLLALSRQLALAPRG